MNASIDIIEAVERVADSCFVSNESKNPTKISNLKMITTKGTRRKREV